MAGILVLENDTATRDVLVPALRGAGFSVDTAETAVSALAIAREQRPDLIFGTISLRNESFLGFCRDLREILPVKGIRIVVLLPPDIPFQQDYGESYGIVEAFTRPLDVSKAVEAAFRYIPGPIQGELFGRETASWLPGGEIREDRIIRAIQKVIGDDTAPAPPPPPMAALQAEAGKDAATNREVKTMDDIWRAPAPARSGYRERRKLLFLLPLSLLLLLACGYLVWMNGQDREVSGDTVRSGYYPEMGGGDPFDDLIRRDRAGRGFSTVSAQAEQAPTGSLDSEVNQSEPPTVAGRVSVYTVQVGAFALEANASALATRLSGMGFSPAMHAQTFSDGRVIHRLLVGAFGTRALAEAELLRLKALSVEGYVTDDPRPRRP